MALTDAMFPARAVGAERIILSGNVDSADAVEGCPGMTAAGGATGVLTLTLPGKGTVDVMSAVFTVEGASLYAHVSNRDDSARTIEVTLKTDAGVATDLAAGDFLHFLIVVKNSSLLNA